MLIQLFSVAPPSQVRAADTDTETESTVIIDENLEIEEDTLEDEAHEVTTNEESVLSEESVELDENSVNGEMESIDLKEESVEVDENNVNDEMESIDLKEEIDSNEILNIQPLEDDSINQEKEQPFQTRIFSQTSSVKEVNYVATIVKGSHSIDTLPWGDTGYKKLANAQDYLGKTVQVTKETTNGSYGYIYINDIGFGWIDLRAIEKIDAVKVDYSDYITGKNYGVDSLPWGTNGFINLGKTSQYLGVQVQVLYRTNNGAYLYVELDGKPIGWIDIRAFGLKGNEYIALIKDGKYSVDTLPWGTNGFKTTHYSNDFIGTELIVKGSTQDQNYLLIYANNQKLGWIDQRAVESFNTKNVDYQAYIGNGSYSIDTLPWGTVGFKKLTGTSSVLGQFVNITRESENGNYVYITLNNQGIGWADKRSIGLSGSPFKGVITTGNYRIDTLPWGTPNYQKVADANAYRGYELDIQGSTADGRYLLVFHEGNQLGWVDKRAVTRFETLSVNYNAYIPDGSYEINTLPWGTSGFKKIGMTSSLLGSYVQVTKESLDKSYAYITVNGVEKGWVDKRAFLFSGPSYTAIVKNGIYRIDTHPWGSPGYQKVADASSYIGIELFVQGTTKDGKYALISSSNKAIGWIDIRAIKPLNAKSVSYQLRVSNGNYEIDTLPWGELGYQKVGVTSSYLNKVVSITRVSENGSYYYALVDGKPLGWIDKRAFSTLQKVVFLDAGHGGSDSGATYYGVMEKTINLQVSKKIQALLESKGYKVIMSRTTDTALDYSVERSKMANGSGADIFVSVHHNAMPGNDSVTGIETFYYEYDPKYPSKINQELHNDPTRIKQSAELAQSIHSSLIKSTGAFNRGVRRDTFAVLRETAIPAVLLELGFMSNETELEKLTTNSYQDTLAKAVADGIDNYFK